MKYKKVVIKMTDNPLESEDLENVRLVRMEDVQPSRERAYEVVRRKSTEEVIETCVIDGIEYDNVCIVNNDDDSNIGSMVSIKSEDTMDEPETIVPDVVSEVSLESLKETRAPSSWPTLEILPGGVIKKPVKDEPTDEGDTNGPLMFACAKCPQQFRHLVCLVKHVRTHEEKDKKWTVMPNEKTKKTKYVTLSQPCSQSRKAVICTHKRLHKKKSPKKLKT